MNKTVFFDIVRGFPRVVFTQAQEDGLNFILDNADIYLKELNFWEELALCLAIAKHETQDTYEPKELGGYLKAPIQRYYKDIGDLLEIDLVQYPERIHEPWVAIVALTKGLQEDWAGIPDSDLINQWAVVFEHALRASGYTYTRRDIVKETVVIPSPPRPPQVPRKPQRGERKLFRGELKNPPEVVWIPPKPETKVITSISEREVNPPPETPQETRARELQVHWIQRNTGWIK